MGRGCLLVNFCAIHYGSWPIKHCYDKTRSNFTGPTNFLDIYTAETVMNAWRCMQLWRAYHPPIILWPIFKRIRKHASSVTKTQVIKSLATVQACLIVNHMVRRNIKYSFTNLGSIWSQTTVDAQKSNRRLTQNGNARGPFALAILGLVIRVTKKSLVWV